jgi:hypothetical protein
MPLSSQLVAFDESIPILCASIDVQECIDGAGCERVLPEEVNAPMFIRVDLREETVSVRKSDPPQKARHFERSNGRYVLQGVDHGSPDVDSDGVAWTIVLENDTARMVATAAIHQAAIVIFGACTETK